MYFFFDVKALHEFYFSTELFFNIKGMKASYIQLNLDFSKLKGNEKCFEKSGINRPYSKNPRIRTPILAVQADLVLI